MARVAELAVATARIPPRPPGRGPLGDVGSSALVTCLMTGRAASSACRWVRVVDYALQRAAIARHWAQHALPGTDVQAPGVRRAPLDVGCDMFDLQETAPSVGRFGQHLSHVASLVARCGLNAGTPYGRGSDRIDRQVRSPGNATAGVKSMVMGPCASSPSVGTQHCLSGQRNRVPVVVIRTTNTSSCAIRSLHRALCSSRRRSTRGRAPASWGTK
jgi:hypothetical protein